MKRQSKLTSRQSEQEQQLSHQESQQHTAHEFATVEEMLRHDARHTPVPPNIATQSQTSRNSSPTDPLVALDQVIAFVEPAVFLFKDFHPFLTKSNYPIIRKLKEIALHLKNSFKTIVLISPVMEIPTELEKEITVLNFPQPAKEDLGALLDKITHELQERKQVRIELDEAGRERLLQAALGLTL